MLSRRKPRSKLHIESLENRTLFAIGMDGFSYRVDAQGNLELIGTKHSDHVDVADYRDNKGEFFRIRHTNADKKTTQFYFVKQSEVTGDQLIFRGGARHDRFTYRTSSRDMLQVYAWGQQGNDELSGGTNGSEDNGADDFLYGGIGIDTLMGLAGNDTLKGDAEHDILRGGAGNDKLFGGDGQDFLYGEKGDDYLFGGIDDDPDKLVGGTGRDTFDVEWYVGTSGLYTDLDKINDYETDERIIRRGR